MSAENILETVGLTKCYRSYSNSRQRLMELLLHRHRETRAAVCALRGVSLSLGPGEIFGVIGPNGSGKSTLLQIIAGTLRPTTGTLAVQGRLTALLELGAGVDTEMTGRENIMLMGQTHGLDRETVLSRTGAIIEFSELGDAIDHPVKTYSSGMFVRLAFSVSTAMKPDILIVDEALSVGDVGFQLKCLDRLETLIAEGASILLASHDMQLIKNYCTRAICLHQGEVIEEGDPELVTERYLQLMHDRNRGVAGPGMDWQRGAETAVKLSSEGGGIDRVHLEGVRGQALVLSGDIVQVQIDGHLDTGAARPSNPTVVVIVRDVRGYNVYGLSADAAAGLSLVGDTFSVCFAIPMRLASGRYSLTVKLEDRRSDTLFRLIDKHVGACAFTIDASGAQPFLGIADLAGRVL